MKNNAIDRLLKGGGRIMLNEVEAKEVLKEAGIPVNETYTASSREEAVSLGVRLGFPVVLKIVSRELTHKTDVGGVRLNLAEPRQVEDAYDGIIAAVREKHPRAVIDGVSVQRMAHGGTEVIMGMTKDPQFGPMLMFGLGGVLVEVLKDVSFRMVPLAEADARDMIAEIKGYPLLKGFRGRPAVSEDTLAEVLLSFSSFIERHPEIEEVDINPLLAAEDSVLAVDARMVLSREP